MIDASLALPELDGVDDRTRARVLAELAKRLVDTRMRRLGRLEGGLVKVLDRLEETRLELARAQQLQIETLRLVALVEDAR